MKRSEVKIPCLTGDPCFNYPSDLYSRDLGVPDHDLPNPGPEVGRSKLATK